MLKEFKYQIKQKYLWILLVFLVYCALGTVMMLFDDDEDRTKDFSYDINEYKTIEEVQVWYNDLQRQSAQKQEGDLIISTGQISENQKVYYSQLYKYIIDNRLPYDSLVEFTMASRGGFNKNTHFDAFGHFAYMTMVFISMCGLLIGSIVPTIDFTKKTAKLVYTSGENKKKILLKKYAVTLMMLLGLEFAIELISFFVSLVFANSGVQYCYILWENDIYFLNFGQYVLIHILDNFVMCAVFYSIVFFFSFLCKSTIVSTTSVFSLMILYSSIAIRFDNPMLEALYCMPSTGIVDSMALVSYFERDPRSMLFILVYIAIAALLCAGALEATKKFDFSR